MIVEQPTIDLRDTRLAVNEALDCIEWLLKHQRSAVPMHLLRKIDLARSVLSDEESDDGG
jgi:hypothetical protein